MAFYEQPIEMPQTVEKQKVAADYGFATVSQRFRASVVDLVFILIIAVIELFVFVPNIELFGFTFVWLIPATWILCPFIFWLVFKGQTPGKMLFHIRIVRDDGSPMIFYNAVLRFFGQSLFFIPVALAWSRTDETTNDAAMSFVTILLPLLVFGSYWYLINHSHWKQGLHDRIAGTIVIKTQAESDANIPANQASGIEEVSQPYVTYALIIINVLMFFISHGDSAYSWGATNRILIFDYHEYYRLWTAMFLHADISHVFFNMLALYFIGQALERRIGHLRFGLLYLLTGFAGSVASVMLNSPDISGVGASGAVFGIFGALVVHDRVYRHILDTAFNNYWMRWQVGFPMFMNLLNGFTSPSTDIANSVQVDSWAHLGGFIAGLIGAGIVMLTITYVPAGEEGEIALESKRKRLLNTLAGGTAAAIVLMLVFSQLSFNTARTMTIDDFSVTIPRGWRIITEFSSPDFVELCPSSIQCQVLMFPQDDARFGVIIRKIQSLQNAVDSIENIEDDFNQEFTQRHPEARLQEHHELTIDGYPAITYIYTTYEQRFWFYFFKPLPSVLEMIQIDGKGTDIAQHRSEIESIIASIRFDGDGT